MTLHPVVEAASRGELPRWAVASPARVAHMQRVADLLAAWSDEAGLDADECRRWRAMGHLHDACKDAPAPLLRRWLGDEAAGIPDRVLHGPAAAHRLREEGVDDVELLRAVAWHTLGHPELGRAGMALYSADFLEPGRQLRDAWRAGLRERMPAELATVTREILRARIEHRLERNRAVHQLTLAFWNRLAHHDPTVEEAPWAPASGD